MAINPAEVTMRDINFEDLDPLATYWCESTEEFWAERGVDIAKFGSKLNFIQTQTQSLQENGDLVRVAVIEYRGQAIGVHTLTELILGESAVFHAHIWHAEFRGLGIGVISYVKALDFFMRKLKLKKIIFKTPLINLGALRIKKKLGLEPLANVVFFSPLLFCPLQARLYEVDQQLVSQLLAKIE
jgi:RimJ/RimL family protein N-acetyltransferase